MNKQPHVASYVVMSGSGQIWRHFVACLALVAWFAVSNHCGLALMHWTADADATVHHCCESSTNGPAPAPNDAMKVCCKQLRLLPLEAGAKLVKLHPDTLLFEIDWNAALRASAAAQLSEIRRLESAVGPPMLRSFAEVVLQRSVLSHAPPLAAA